MQADAGPRAAAAADANAQAATGSDVTVGELVVTAQKREENINNVGMSIQAASGEKLHKLGITNTEDLPKIVPGFLSTPNYYGTNVYTIRGVGFQDTSLAGSPTVSVYLDEMPLPFSALTNGATLDLQRVEVLKGPQGTLFGQNATGGAINYIANKPTDHFEAGIDAQLRPLQRRRHHRLRQRPDHRHLGRPPGRALQQQRRLAEGLRARNAGPDHRRQGLPERPPVVAVEADRAASRPC